MPFSDFTNRCLEFIAPGGKLAIVLPDSILANSSMQDVRDWILRWARLKAVISLPQETFTPYGAGVKTSIIFLEKRKQYLNNVNQLQISCRSGWIQIHRERLAVKRIFGSVDILQCKFYLCEYTIYIVK